MVEHDKCITRETHSPKVKGHPKLRLAEGDAGAMPAPSQSVTERARLENIKGGGDSRGGSTRPSDSPSLSTNNTEDSAMTQRIRMENRNTAREQDKSITQETHSPKVKGHPKLRLAEGDAGVEDIKASSSTHTAPVGAVAVSRYSASSRPRRSKKIDQEAQLNGEADEELGLEDGAANLEEKETLLEAEVAPDVEELVQKRLEEERRNQQNNNNEDSADVVIATATEASEDEDDSNGDQRFKRIIEVLVLVIVFVAGVIAASLLLSNNDPPLPAPMAPTPTDSPSPEPTLAPTTLAPTLPQLKQTDSPSGCEGTSGNGSCFTPAPTTATPSMSPTTAMPTLPRSISRLEQIQASLRFGDGYSNDKTMTWLVESDVWFPPSDASNPETLWKERYTMARISFSTSGWSLANSWLTPDSVCGWGCCDASWDRVVCDKNGRVTSLAVNDTELEGSLPFDIFDDMTAMTSLDISRNRLSGSFPRLPANLEFVGLYQNNFQGIIPRDLFTDLTKLTSLGMSNNVMVGDLPPLPPNVESMWMNNNRFSGTIPKDFFAPYTKLTHMTFTNNQLSGSLPLLPPNLVRC